MKLPKDDPGALLALDNPALQTDFMFVVLTAWTEMVHVWNVVIKSFNYQTDL